MPTLRPSRDLLADRVVLQPYGFWHRPAVRTAVVVLALVLGVFGASWFFAPVGEDASAIRAENEALRARLAAAERELEAARIAVAGTARDREAIARERDAAVRELHRLRNESSPPPQRVPKRRDRRGEGEEPRAGGVPQTAVVPTPESPPVVPAPRAE